MARTPPIQEIDMDALEQDLLGLNKIRDCVRLGSFGLAAPLVRARQAQMQREAARARRLFGEDDPETARLEGNLERATTRFNLVADETARAQVVEPDFDPETGTLWGRVVDDAVPQKDLSVAVEGDGVQLAFTCTDAKGSFTLKVPPQTRTRLIVRAKDGAMLYRDPGALTLKPGQQVYREIDLTRGAEAPCPDPSGDPVADPESFAMVGLVGQPESTALSIIRNLKLRPGKRSTEPAPEQIGLIRAHSPAEGETVTPGTRVDYTVGVSDQLTVPRLIGLPPEGARARLNAVGLVFGSLERVIVSGETPGLIVDQSPLANTLVARDTAINLTVGIPDPNAPSTVTVPRVMGESLDRAAAMLEEVGLTSGSVTEVQARGDTVGLVLNQRPSANAVVAEGSAVALFLGVEADPVSEAVPVPEIFGSTAEEAREKLGSAGLAIGEISQVPVPREKVGQVLTQDPDPGALVDPGSAVSFELGVPLRQPDTVVMPQVTGKIADDAVAELAELGLDTTLRDRAVRSRAQVGIVLDQVPAAGRVLPPGTGVAIVVGVLADLPQRDVDPAMGDIIAAASERIGEDPNVTRERLFAAGVTNPDRVAEVASREPAELRDILGLPNVQIARRHRTALRRALNDVLG